MKVQVLDSLKTKRPVSKKKIVDTSFEKDWENGISGNEVVKRVHEHIEKLYASRKKQ